MDACRWQCKPADNYCLGFSDHATFKLVEMTGAGWGPTVASLHLGGKSRKAATLYMAAAAAANPEWQDLIVLLALIALQQELIRRIRASSGAASL